MRTEQWKPSLTIASDKERPSEYPFSLGPKAMSSIKHAPSQLVLASRQKTGLARAKVGDKGHLKRRKQVYALGLKELCKEALQERAAPLHFPAQPP